MRGIVAGGQKKKTGDLNRTPVSVRSGRLFGARPNVPGAGRMS